MDLTISWDLFVIVFFGLVMSYSFIIGKHESVKIIVFAYIAIVAGMAAGTLLERLTTNSETLLSSFGFVVNVTMLDAAKLIIFIATIILLAIRGGFDVEYGNDDSSILNTIFTGVFGFATAGLLLVTLLTFVAGTPFLDPALAFDPALVPVVGNSKLVRMIVENQDVWFILPALLLIVVGIISNNGNE